MAVPAGSAVNRKPARVTASANSVVVSTVTVWPRDRSVAPICTSGATCPESGVAASR